MAEPSVHAPVAEPGLRLRLRRAWRRGLFLSVHALVRRAGLAHARTLGAALGELQFRWEWLARRRMQRDVAWALGRASDDPSVRALLREAYRVNDAAVVEVMAILERRHDDAELAARCEIDGLGHLREAMAQGRGVILLAAHMGNMALLPLVLAASGWPVSVVCKEARMMSDGFLLRGFERYGVQGILANAGIRAYAQMLGALKQGRIVFLMLDQGVKSASDGSVVRFLGKDMPMSAGPAQLARASRAPVLPVATTAADPRWRFEIEAPVELSRESLEADLARLVGATERQVLRHPQFWSWHQRRWRAFPVSAR
jgi:KDO2-lipid IV(A) lauroyltransferase